MKETKPELFSLDIDFFEKPEWKRFENNPQTAAAFSRLIVMSISAGKAFYRHPNGGGIVQWHDDPKKRNIISEKTFLGKNVLVAGQNNVINNARLNGYIPVWNGSEIEVSLARVTNPNEEMIGFFGPSLSHGMDISAIVGEDCFLYNKRTSRESALVALEGSVKNCVIDTETHDDVTTILQENAQGKLLFIGRTCPLIGDPSQYEYDVRRHADRMKELGYERIWTKIHLDRKIRNASDQTSAVQALAKLRERIALQRRLQQNADTLNTLQHLTNHEEGIDGGIGAKTFKAPSILQVFREGTQEPPKLKR